jgi:hypothetical protein
MVNYKYGTSRHNNKQTAAMGNHEREPAKQERPVQVVRLGQWFRVFAPERTQVGPREDPQPEPPADIWPEPGAGGVHRERVYPVPDEFLPAR